MDDITDSLKDDDIAPFTKASEFQKSPLSSERSWTERTLGKMEAGSVRGSIFALVSTAIGAGCLTIPLIFNWLGIFLGLFMIFAGAFSSYYGLMGISLAADKHKIYNYPVLARKVLGNRWGNILDVTIILYVYGTLIGYQIMIGTFVPSISKSLGLEENESQERIIVMCVACVGIMIPLGMFKELSSFRFVSMLSGFTLLYITVLIIAEFGIFVNHNNFARVNYFDININIFSGYAFCLYSFTCHTNIAQVQGELRESNIRRTKKVALRTIVGVMVPYILLSLFGYLSVMDNTPTLIIMRQAPEELQNHDGAMVLAKVLMSITLILAVPINVPPFRTTIIRVFFKQENPSTVLHVSVTLFVLLTSLGVAIVYPSIKVLFGFLGGFCCGIMVLVIPSLLRCAIHGYEQWSLWYNINVGGFFLLFLVGSTSAILEVAGVS